MRRAVSFVGLFLLIVMLAGCSNPVQDDLIQYSNESMPTLFLEEDSIISTYDSVVGPNFTDDSTTYYTLIDDVIPRYTDYIRDVEAVNIETKELQEVHEIYIDGLKEQHTAFLTLAEAIELGDFAKVDQANAMLAESQRLIDEYQKEIDRLASEHDVVFK